MEQQNYTTPSTIEFRKADKSVMTYHNWVKTIILTCIPFFGLMFICLWALGKGNINENKRNYAKAALTISLVVLVLVFTFGGINYFLSK